MDSISIIIPIYNSEKTIANCLQSVLAQLNISYEVILIDDGSTDASAAICSSYIQNDSRIQYHYQAHSGVSVARNLGIQYASGSFIGFVDADDIIEPDMFSCMYLAMFEEQSDICVCAYYDHIGQSSAKISNPSITSPMSAQKAISLIYSEPSMEGFVWNKLYKASLLKEHYFHDNLLYCEDLVLNSEILSLSNSMCSVSYISMPLYHYQKHETSLTCSTQYFINLEFIYHPAYSLLENFVLPEMLNPKYYNILIYTMYILLNQMPNSRDQIVLLKKHMQSLQKKILMYGATNIHDKLYYLTQAWFPIIYRKIFHPR